MVFPDFVQLEADSGDTQRQIEDAARKDERDISNALRRKQRQPPVSAPREIPFELFDMDNHDSAPYQISE
jgi:hypothetical protein